jgi:Holliday junction resolvase RusA-like endonuclease
MSESLTLRIPRELKSPNTWNGRHWRYKHRETQEWEQFIWVTLAKQARSSSVLAVLTVMNALPPKRVCSEKRKVTVTRLVPSARNFIRDDDNLRFSVKPLLDALKRLGLIRDDNRKWIDLPMPVQAVSESKNWVTVIEIATVDPIDEALDVLEARSL